jgi:hypothetical protein
MGFEPSTFCMASRAYGDALLPNCLQMSRLRRARAVTAVRELTPIHGDLGTEWGLRAEVVSLAIGSVSPARPVANVFLGVVEQLLRSRSTSR